MRFYRLVGVSGLNTGAGHRDLSGQPDRHSTLRRTGGIACSDEIYSRFVTVPLRDAEDVNPGGRRACGA
jgi:hypothetical protein